MQRLTRVLLWVAVLTITASSYAWSREDDKKTLTGCSRKFDKYPDYPELFVVDTIEGQDVFDPFRGLEHTSSEKTQKWLNAQNRFTSKYLKPTLNIQERIQKFFESNFTEPRAEWLFTDEKGEPLKIGDYYYFEFHEAGATGNWAIMRTKNKSDVSQGEEVITSYKWGGPMRHLVTLGGVDIIQNGKYLVYKVGKFGSDWSETFVLDLTTGKPAPDEFKLMKGGISISPDQKTCIYAQYPEPGRKYVDGNKHAVVKLHTFGTPTSQDKIIYADRNLNQGELGAYFSKESGEVIIDRIDPRYKGNAVLRRPISEIGKPGVFEEIIPHSIGADFHHMFTTDKGYIFLTNHGAPNRKLVFIPKKSNSPKDWEQIIAEDKEGFIESIHPIGKGGLVVHTIMNGVSSAKIYTWEGKVVAKIPSPGPGTLGGFRVGQNGTILFTYEDFVTPGAQYVFLPEKNESVLLDKPRANDPLKDYVYEHVMYPSADGTKVPMQILRHKNTKLDGTAPLYLHAYGGFEVNMLPGFNSKFLLWAQLGGIVAIPNIRGGAEMGGNWHKDGSVLSKQNSFKDFISAAEWLIEKGYTSKKRIGIEGGSNGGLLVAACAIMRPDLWGAALPNVGVYDMIRFQKFTRGFHWINEYGSLRRKEEVAYMLTYSPYHIVKPGVEYPPMMIVTGNKDDRVTPVHSYKLAAALQKAQKEGSLNPILLRINANSAHGPGTRLEYVKQLAEELGFFMDMLGMQLPIEKTQSQ